MRREHRFFLAALICALLAGVLTYRAVSGSGSGHGEVASVVVTGEDLAAGRTLSERDVSTFAVRSLPREYAPPGALTDPLDAVGRHAAVELPAGTPVTDAILSSAAGRTGSFGLRRGERAVSLDVVVSPAGEQLAAGAMVDLLASGLGGEQRTHALIDGAEVLAVLEGRDPAHPVITVRLSKAQAPVAIRADVFARELRAVVLPARRS